MARHRRLRRPPVVEPLYTFRSVVYCTLIFLACTGVAVILSMSTGDSSHLRSNSRQFSDPDEIPPSILASLDAVLVLGGGVPESIDRPPVYVRRRADDAAAVVHKYAQQKRKNTSKGGLPVLCLSAGTAHLPQLLSPDGLPIWESTSCAAYLAQKHDITENVFVETTSYDTIGNAFYTRTTHTDINGWRKLLVITNEFHMDRTAAIFDWIFQCGDDKYNLHYLASPNVGLSEEAVQARREREGQSANHVRETLAPKYKTLAAVWEFLTHDHVLYTASKLIERGRGSGSDSNASEIVKKSYGASGAG